MFDLEHSLGDIIAKLDSTADLVYLSAMMDDPSDELIINSLLARRIPLDLRQIALARNASLQSAVECSASAVVNTYANKTIALADKTTDAFNAIHDRAASVVNSPR